VLHSRQLGKLVRDHQCSARAVGLLPPAVHPVSVNSQRGQLAVPGAQPDVDSALHTTRCALPPVLHPHTPDPLQSPSHTALLATSPGNRNHSCPAPATFLIGLLLAFFLTAASSSLCLTRSCDRVRNAASLIFNSFQDVVLVEDRPKCT
jgi:hypothetical protein